MGAMSAVGGALAGRKKGNDRPLHPKVCLHRSPFRGTPSRSISFRPPSRAAWTCERRVHGSCQTRLGLVARTSWCRAPHERQCPMFGTIFGVFGFPADAALCDSHPPFIHSLTSLVRFGFGLRAE
eukprot:366152-Chlamydomonas_euryale.AAC.2